MALHRRQFLSLAALAAGGCVSRPAKELLHVSFDATRSLLDRLAEGFQSRFADQGLRVLASHGGSGKQTRSVLEGLDADLVSLALPRDVDILAQAGHVTPGWRQRAPHDSSPFYSAVVLLVRAGNPKRIFDFEDVLRDDVVPLTPNPKTSGGARWNQLALFGARLMSGSRERAGHDVKKLYERTPILPAGARLALTTFLDRGIADVLLAWESEAQLAASGFGRGRVEVVYPKRTIACDVPLTVVDRVIDRRASRTWAEAYLAQAYEGIAQQAAVDAFFRPRSREVLARAEFSPVELFDVSELGPAERVESEHFGNEGWFETAMLERSR